MADEIPGPHRRRMKARLLSVADHADVRQKRQCDVPEDVDGGDIRCTPDDIEVEDTDSVEASLFYETIGDNDIRFGINTDMVQDMPKEGKTALYIHEITHFQVDGHPEKFWKQMRRNAKSYFESTDTDMDCGLFEKEVRDQFSNADTPEAGRRHIEDIGQVCQ